MTRKPSQETTSAWARLVRVQQGLLAAVEQDLKTAGFPPLAWYDALLELSRAPSGEMRPVELEKLMLIPQILDLAADRPSGGRGAGGAPRMQDRQARSVRRDHRNGARITKEDVGRVLGGDRKACRLQIVGCRCRQTVRSA